MKERVFDLQDRLIDFAVRIIKLSNALPETRAGKHVSGYSTRINRREQNRLRDMTPRIAAWVVAGIVCFGK